MKCLHNVAQYADLKPFSYIFVFITILLLFSTAQAAPGDQKWTYTTGNVISASPTIGYDGTVYIGSYDSILYALNTDGTQQWSYNLGGIVYSSPAVGCDGVIYIGSFDNNLYAINPDGTQKWTFTTGNDIYSTPAIDCNGTIYVGSYDDNLYAINPDGTQKWAFTTGGDIFSSPAISNDGTIYFGSKDNNIYALNPNGTQKWIYTTGGQIFSSPAIGSDGTIYVGAQDNKLYAIAPDGTLKWTFTAGNIVRSSPAIASDGTIYVGSEDNKLYALNTDGTQKWVFTSGNSIRSSPAIGKDGTIYVGSYDDKLYALNTDGSQKWAFTATSDFASSSPAIGSDGTIYIGSVDKKLYAVEGESGGLACMPWPKFHQNNKNNGRKVGYEVASSSTQDSGIIAGVSYNCAKEMTNTELNEKYSVQPYADQNIVIAFNASINVEGGCGTFVLNSTAIPSGKVSDISLVKLYESKGISRPYASYAASGPEYGVDGSWWLTDSSGNHMAPSDRTTLGTEYNIYFVIKDNGLYDENDTLGKITDPVVIVNSSGGSGCVLNPNAHFSLEWLFMGLAVVALILGKRLRQRD